jgi:hypothetical protein
MYAVITGDLVRSEKLLAERGEVLDRLNTTLEELRSSWGEEGLWVSPIYRGDSFQIVADDATKSLRIALFMRAQLMRYCICGKSLEARAAIGIGDIEYLDRENITESDGEAFRLSGRSLEEIPSYRRLIVRTSIDALNPALESISALIDALSARWSREQGEAISHWLIGATQSAMAESMHISQPAVQQRLQRAGHYALAICFKQMETMLKHYK